MNFFVDSVAASELAEPADPLLDRFRPVRNLTSLVVPAEDVGLVRGFPIPELAKGDVAECTWSSEYREWGDARTVTDALATTGIDRREGVLSGARTRWRLQKLRILRAGGHPVAGTFADAIARVEASLGADATLLPLPGDPADREFLSPVKGIPQLAPLSTLVLLPALGSTVQASFQALLTSAEWRSLQRQYSGSIVGFCCPTLSRDPLGNALALIEALPDGARPDLLALSGGGLLAELLVGPAPSPEERQLLVDRGLVDLADRLDTLARRRVEKDITVQRVLRVGCPIRGLACGTTSFDVAGESGLASILGHLVNLADLTPGFVGGEVPAALLSILIEGLSRKASLKEVPGLAALSADSPLLAWVNRPREPVQGLLGVIAGNSRAEGLFREFGLVASDRLATQDHDLLVTTRAMRGGVRRKTVEGDSGTGEHLLMVEGPEVRHHAYLSDPSVRKHAVRWLCEGRDDDFVPQGDLWSEDATVRVLARTGDTRPIVYLVPDFMGTHLAVDGARVWLDPVNLARLGLGALSIERAGVTTDGIFAEPYRRLMRSLSVDYDVRPFGWDWRHSVVEGAEALARVLTATSVTRPTHFVAHGAGGLLVRCLAGKDPTLWKSLGAAGGGRLVMLGTPNAGSYSVLRLLAGNAEIVAMLERLGLGRDDVVGFFRGCPGFFELLPPEDRTSVKEVALWDEFGLEPPTKDIETGLETFYGLMRKGRDGERMFWIGGTGVWTPRWMAQRVCEGDLGGDGQVLASTGRDDLPSWRVPADHAHLADYPPAFPAIADLIANGTTSRLQAASDSSDGVRRADPSPRASVLFPVYADLVQAALSGNLSWSAETRQSLSVCVTHGGVLEARHPVLVGHEEEDAAAVGAFSLGETESLLDSRLQGRVTRRLQLGLFRGKVGTFEGVVASDDRSVGALIVGLGRFDELTAASLQATLVATLSRYALDVHESASAGGERTWRSAAISVHLRDRVSARGLTPEDLVATVVEAVLRTNENLRRGGLWDHVRVDEIEFIEPFSSLAIQTAHAVRNVQGMLRCAVPADMPLDLPEEVRTGVGARSGAPPSAPARTRAWQRVIVSGTAEQLDFNVPSADAQSRVYRLPLQPADVEATLKGATSSSSYTADFSVALQKLFMPAPVLAAIAEGNEVVLNLDAMASRVPWELFGRRAPSAGGDVEPLATQCGFVRQLQSARIELGARPRPCDRALVIGDPVGVFPALPAAADEAEQVVQVLREAGFKVTALIQADAPTILRTLRASEWGIVHAATHGRYDPANPDQSGLLIGDGVVLTAAQLSALSPSPSVVFLNACHVGRIDQEDTAGVETPHRFAAGLAQELIARGVPIVVAAGWAINSAAARTFALALYRSILSGIPFGRAVQTARQRTFEAHPDRNTFGAYQCYGDPEFILPRTERRLFVSRKEVLSRIEALRENIRVHNDRDAARQEIASLEAALLPSWRDGELLAALSCARADVGDLEQAQALGEAALRQDDAPLWLAERLGEVEEGGVRRLRKEADQVSPPDEALDVKVQCFTDPPHGISEIERQGLLEHASRLEARRVERCEGLVRLAPSAERHHRLGTVFLERALRATPTLLVPVSGDGAKPAENPDLGRAHRSFEHAWTVSLEDGTPDPRSWVAWALSGLASRRLARKRFLGDAARVSRICLAQWALTGEYTRALAYADVALVRLLGLESSAPGAAEAVGVLYRRVIPLAPGGRNEIQAHIEAHQRLFQGREPAAAALVGQVLDNLDPQHRDRRC